MTLPNISKELKLCWWSYVVDRIVSTEGRHLIDGTFPRILSNLGCDSIAQLPWTVGMTSCTLLILANCSLPGDNFVCFRSKND
jgi:hypothetical protein